MPGEAAQQARRRSVSAASPHCFFAADEAATIVASGSVGGDRTHNWVCIGGSISEAQDLLGLGRSKIKVRMLCRLQQVIIYHKKKIVTGVSSGGEIMLNLLY